MNGGHRISELLGAISLATDQARGQAPESALGTTILATRIAERMGLDDQGVADTYFAALTRTLGCTTLAMDAARLALGDDLSFSYALHMSDLADPASVQLGLETYFAPDAEPEAREKAIRAVLDLHMELPNMAVALGQQASSLTSRLPVPPAVPVLLADSDARWDGLNPNRPAARRSRCP